jgi:hypothetical protein
MQHAFHQPYSGLLVSEALLSFKSSVRMSRQLCTDLAALHSEGSCAVQVSVVVHPAGWGDSQDCRAYILQQPQHANAAQQQQVVASHGPFDATLKERGSGAVQVVGLKHDGELLPYVDTAHTLVLQERVSFCQWLRLGLAAVALYPHAEQCCASTSVLCFHSTGCPSWAMQ